MITVEKNSKTPIYAQIYDQILAEITGGKMKPGQVLTGSRTLARELGVGRNTIDNAYDQLTAEGYIAPRRGVGFVVLDGLELMPPKASKTGFATSKTSTAAAKASAAVPGNLPAVSLAKSEAPGKSGQEAKPLYDMYYGNLSEQFFPYSLWKRCTRDILLGFERGKVNCYQERQGDPYLREQLAGYLEEARGVVCSPEQMIITCGLQSSLDLLCKLLFPPGSGGVLGMEEPGYDKTAFVFENNGVKIHPIAVDDKGAVASELPGEGKVKAVYVTPSHQLPIGAVMPIGRRYELLSWAKENDAYILEDDYDSEYNYCTNPIPSLQSIDQDNRVIYLGTFSKSLSPSVRMGYLVLPPQLLGQFRETMQLYNCTASWLSQRITAQMIAEGQYRKQIRKLRTAFKRRHDLLLKEVGRMSGDAEILNPGAGLNFLLRVDCGKSREELIESAMIQGVKVYSPLRFWRDKNACPENIVFIGYSALEEEDIPRCVRLLEKAWFE